MDQPEIITKAPVQTSEASSSSQNPFESSQSQSSQANPQSSSRFPKLFIFILIPIAISASGAAAYFFYQNQQLTKKIKITEPSSQSNLIPTPIPTPTPSPDPTVNWQTGTYLALSFRYPQTWQLDTSSREFKLTPKSSEETYPPAIVIGSTENTKELSLAQLHQEAQSWEIYHDTYSTTGEPIEVDNLVGYLKTNQNCEPRTCDRIVFLHDQQIYSAVNIYSGLDQTEEEKSKQLELFRQILSTFEFTSNETSIDNSDSEWTTYSNTLHGYSISFPSTWKTHLIAAGAGSQEATPESNIVDIGNSQDSTTPYPSGIITIQGLTAKPTYPTSWSFKAVTINGIEATKYFTSDGTDGPTTTYLIPKPDNSFIEIIHRSSQEDNIYPVLEEIVSTFKLTN